MIIGNKCDLNERRQITKEKGQQLANEYNVRFLETSAKASINVEESFLSMARAIKSKMDRKAGVSGSGNGTAIQVGRGGPTEAKVGSSKKSGCC